MSDGMTVEWEEARMDVIGQNGNIGYSIDEATPQDWDALKTKAPTLEEVRAVFAKNESPLEKQVDGDHYSKLKIQPVEYIHANNLPFIEGCIVKYITRWRDKGGFKDIEKIKHFCDLLMELEGK
jgi:hypothetical protein